MSLQVSGEAMVRGESPIFRPAVPRHASSRIGHAHSAPAAPQQTDAIARTASVSSTLSPPSQEVQQARQLRGLPTATSYPSMSSISSQVLGFTPYPHWQREPERSVLKVLQVAQAHTLTPKPKLASSLSSLEDEDTSTFSSKVAHSIDNCIVHPSSQAHVIWGLLGAVFVSFDMLVVPFALCFGLPAGSRPFVASCATLVFWTLDLLAGFCMGYVEKGAMIVIPSKVVLRYLRTWFGVDATILAVDWAVFMSCGTDERFSGWDVVKMLRLLKLWRIVANLQDCITTELLEVLFDLGQLILFVLLISHSTACIWYAISDNLGSDGERAWVTEDPMLYANREYLYMTALQWALSKIMLESMEISPQNLNERRFAVICQVVGLFVFSSMISRITSSMIQLGRMRNSSMKQFALLRRYLRERRVEHTLSLRIQRYLRHTIQARNKQVATSTVKLLALLTKQLQNELNFAISEPKTSAHPFFAHLSQVSEVMMLRLISTTISQMALACDDNLYFAGEAARSMYFIDDGELQYVEAHPISDLPSLAEEPSMMQLHRRHSEEGRRLRGDRTRNAQSQEWLCEPVLWTRWVHLGDVHATTECALISIDAAKFGEVLCMNKATWEVASSYCRNYLEALNRKAPQDLCDLGGMKERDILIGYINEFRGQHTAPRRVVARVWSAPWSRSWMGESWSLRQ